MKKIFIVTGEPSGDKLASTVISKLKNINPNIENLCWFPLLRNAERIAISFNMSSLENTND